MLRNRNKILGMNARSSVYLRANTKRARLLADDKLRTKQVVAKQGIPTAELLAVLRTHTDVRDFDWNTLPASFVIKPNRGLGGEGILVVFNRLKNGNWLTTSKRQLTEEDLAVHVHNILDGNFSLYDQPDIALFEARLSISTLYKPFASEGIPDIRVIVYNTVPVMAMLRVPTKRSEGKANLMQGGLGIGIDITTGFTTHVIMKSWLYEKEIERHPDTNMKLRGIKLPYWDEILKTAVIAAHVTGIAFCGVDISVDKKRGPVVMELNARPGLGIQVANMLPLAERLARIRGLKVETPERGIAIAKELFGGQLEHEVASITGRTVIGLSESLTVVGKGDTRKVLRAKIDTGADDSSIDMDLARELGFAEAVDLFTATVQVPENIMAEEAQELVKQWEPELKKKNSDITRLSVVSSSHGVSIRMHVSVSVTLAEHIMKIEPNVYMRSHLKYPILIGRRNLSHFLIDTTKVPRKVVKTVKKAAATEGAGQTAKSQPAQKPSSESDQSSSLSSGNGQAA